MKTRASLLSMGEGPVGKVLFRLALPSVITMVMHNLFHLADTIFISRLGGISLAAMSLTFPVVFMLFALLNGMATGNTALVSRALGQDLPEKAQEITRAATTLMLLLSLGALPLLHPETGRAFFALLGGRAPVIPLCMDYLVWLLPSVPFMAIMLLGDSTFRCQGNTMIPLYSMMLGNGINILLDPLFIFTFHMGITGAALATFLGRAAGAAFVIHQIRHRSEVFLFPPANPFSLRILREWKDILVIGFPASLTQGSMALGIILMNRVLSHYGTQALAAWLLGNRVEGLAFLPVMGLRTALTPFIGYNLGHHREDRVVEGLKWGLGAALVMMLSVGTLIYVFPHVILKLFSPSRQIQEMAVASIRASVIGYPLAATEITLMALFEGTGKTLFSMTSQIFRALFLRPPLGWLLGSLFGLSALWWCQPLSSLGSWILTVTFALFLLRNLRRKAGEKSQGI